MKIDISTYNKTHKKNKDNLFDFKLSANILNRFSDKKKEEFYREFSTLIKSGIDFNQALQILAEQQKSIFLKSIYKKINNDVVKGKTLHEAIKSHKYFTPYEYYSIKIGEETRSLTIILDQLEKFFTRKISMKRQIISVLAYPVFVILITFGVLYFMLNFVVPMFASLFQQFGKDLPKITMFVVKISKHFNLIIGLFFILIVSIFLINKSLKNNDSYQSALSKITLNIPFFGGLIKKIYLARFCQSLSLLLSAKTPLITALDLTEKMISFYPLKKAVKEAKIDVLKGGSLANSLKKHSIFTPKIISLTVIGEQINELDQMYDSLSNQYNNDIDHSTKLIGTIMEPVMIILIGGIVGFIMIAMYSPIFDMSKILER